MRIYTLTTSKGAEFEINTFVWEEILRIARNSGWPHALPIEDYLKDGTVISFPDGYELGVTLGRMMRKARWADKELFSKWQDYIPLICQWLNAGPVTITVHDSIFTRHHRSAERAGLPNE